MTMTNQEMIVVKGNQELVTLMGYELIGNSSYICTVGAGTESRNEILPLRYMKFDKCWDWIMPIVDRVENICSKEKDLKYYFDDKNGYIISLFGELYVKSEIKGVYTDLVNFARFYNKK